LGSRSVAVGWIVSSASLSVQMSVQAKSWTSIVSPDTKSPSRDMHELRTSLPPSGVLALHSGLPLSVVVTPIR